MFFPTLPMAITAHFAIDTRERGRRETLLTLWNLHLVDKSNQ